MRRTALVFCFFGSQAFADSRFDIYAHPRPPAITTEEYKGLGIESVTKEDIAKFAPPPLEPQVERRIQAMLDVRGPGAGVITSKGDRMYFTSKVTGTNHVWRQDGPMQYAVQMTGGEDRTSVVGIAPDDSFVVVTRDIGGEENPGLYLMKPGGGALTLVQHTPKVQTFLQFISDDSKSLVYRANDVEPSSFAIYRYEIATGKKERVFDEKGLWQVADQRGNAWLLQKSLGSTQDEIYSYEVSTKKLVPLLGQGESEQYRVAFGAKPGQVLVRTNKLGEFWRIYSHEGGKLTPITPELAWDVDAFAFDRKDRIYYRVNEGGYSRTFVLDAKTFKPIALPKLPAGDGVSFSGISHNGRFASFNVESATALTQNFTYDWQTKKLAAWRVAMSPEIDATAFVKVALEYYPARDGTKIPMLVRRPAKCSTPCPVVVSFHGGPEQQSRPGFAAGAQLFVEAGFIFVEPNVRGSLGYGKAWQHADDGPKRLDVVTDIEDCAKFIRANWGSPKIGVTGGSYGGYSTLMAMTYFAGAYDAGVQVVGIANFHTFLTNTAAYRRIMRSSEYGDPVKDKDALTKLSPMTYIEKIRAPLLSIQGVNDPRVPVGEALQIYRELERRKIPGGLILFPDEGHGAQKRDNQALSIGHTLAFFEKHLMGK